MYEEEQGPSKREEAFHGTLGYKSTYYYIKPRTMDLTIDSSIRRFT